MDAPVRRPGDRCAGHAYGAVFWHNFTHGDERLTFEPSCTTHTGAHPGGIEPCWPNRAGAAAGGGWARGSRPDPIRRLGAARPVHRFL